VIPATIQAMIRRLILLSVLCLSLAAAANLPWDKPPEQWTQSDVYRILQDSPWSPAKFSLESTYSQRRTDPQSGVVSDSPINARNTAVVPGVTLARAHPLPPVTVLWWSSKTIRLAESKRVDSRGDAKNVPEKIDLADLAEYVLALEGDEPLRILRNAREDLHDTVFLELENGGSLDFSCVKFVEDTGAETLRTEFHFPRLLNGQPAIDPESDRVVFHCRANAKKEMPARENSLSFRVEFSPRAMKVRGQPDL